MLEEYLNESCQLAKDFSTIAPQFGEVLQRVRSEFQQNPVSKINGKELADLLHQQSLLQADLISHSS